MNTFMIILVLYVIAIAGFGAAYYMLNTKKALTNNEIKAFDISAGILQMLITPICFIVRTIIQIAKGFWRIVFKLLKAAYYRRQARKIFGI